MSSEKNDTKINEIGWVVLILWSLLKIDHCHFSLNFPDVSGRDNGFSDFHTYIVPRTPIDACEQNKDRTKMDSYTRCK